MRVELAEDIDIDPTSACTVFIPSGLAVVSPL